MRGAPRVPRHAISVAPAATHVVRFEPRPKRASQREQVAPAGRVPRVARLLALAHRIDGMIRSGELRDWAQAARLLGITRARMTQIANLLLLAPRVQEGILDLSNVTRGRDAITERALREASAHVDWQRQGVSCVEPEH